MAYTREATNNHTYIHACIYVCSVQFSSRWYPCTQNSQYVLHPVSQKFPQCHLWNGSNVRLIDDDPFSSFHGKLSSTSSFHSSLFQMISGVMPLAFVPTGSGPRSWTLLKSKPLVSAALPTCLSAQSFPFTSACPGQYTHSFQRWTSTTDTF